MGLGRWSRRVFISYRRQRAQAHALSFYQGFADVLGRKAVFLDVGENAMRAGRSWKDSVRAALLNCDTLCLVFDPAMPERLTDGDDPVRFELETAYANRL